MLEKAINTLVGSKQDRDLKKLLPLIHKINALEPWALQLKDSDFPLQTIELRERLTSGSTLDDLLPQAFALAREAGRRTLGERPYDVQLMGSIVLHQGKIMEMKTGEGKTLSSVAAAYLNALPGKGVHIITVNDYLAERDAKWMAPVYGFMGLDVGAILSHMDPEARQLEYARDITYGTNNEFGFDYLRDNMRWDLGKKAQKVHHYCIIDEIDSILIDEARTPLIISGAVQEDTSKIKIVSGLVHFLKEVEKDIETGRYPDEDPFGNVVLKGDYKVDEKGKRISFTDEGMNHIEEILQGRKLISGSLFDENNFEFTHYITQAMKALYLFHKDVDYVVQDGKVEIVDEFTGRVLHGRRYSEGLHQAIEAKENIKVAQKNKTLATITFQNYFRMYDKLSGMTGTADTEAREFSKIYGLDVVVIPTNRPVNRLDEDDIIFINEEYKVKAICDEIEAAHKKGQPVLVGTISIEKSEELSKALLKKGVRHEILNAKNHSREALIIAEAGAKGSVTIATNMAGRGTDIKLGGNPEYKARKRAGTDATHDEYRKAYEIEYEKWQTDNEAVKKAGGLFVIGTERHESRRIDNQLRGRSGRQGDPGKSIFFICLDDDLMRLFGGESFRNMMGRLGMSGGEPLHHSLINKTLEKAQRRVEDRNFDIRKHLLEYDDVLNNQRTFIYNQRDSILTDDKLKERVWQAVEDLVEDMGSNFTDQEKKENYETALKTMGLELKEKFHFSLTADAGTKLNGEEWKNTITKQLESELKEKESLVGQENLNQYIRFEYLRQVDQKWQDHLDNLESLREAVSLRSYAQKNPLVEYKLEGFKIFDELISSIRSDIACRLMKVQIKDNRDAGRRRSVGSVSANHSASGLLGSGGGGERNEANARGMQVKRTTPKVGRNEPCPCGSGKKYKNCHGR